MRTHKKRFHLRASFTEAQQLSLVQEDVSNASPSALPLSDANSAILSAPPTAYSTACPRCQVQAEPRSKNIPICESCYQALQEMAREANERDYLARWLHSRVDANGFLFEDSALTASPSDRRTVQRLFTRAKLLGVDWTQPPMVVSDATRIRALLAPFGGEAA